MTLSRDLYRRLLSGLPEEEHPTGAFFLPGEPVLVAHQFLAERLSALHSQPAASDAGSPRTERKREDLRELFSTWLYYQGPLDAAAVPAQSPFPDPLYRSLAAEMGENGDLVRDLLTDDAVSEQIMHREAYERALSWIRARHRAGEAFRIPLRRLPGLTARWQGIDGNLSRGEALSLLEGIPLPAGLWEEAVLPLRCAGGRDTELDELLRERVIVWRGSPGRRVSFHAADFVPPPQESPDKAGRTPPLLPASGAFTLWEIGELNGLTPSESVERIWEQVWEGKISADTFAPVREAVARRFRPPRAAASRGKGRSGFARWSSALPLQGNWFSLKVSTAEDALERLEEAKSAARILFERYALVFREQLAREESPYRWQDVFPALRLMEFSGEVIGGTFLEEVPGIQFLLTANAGRLREYLGDRTAPYLIHISDPASPAGIALDFFREHYPPRRGSQWLVVEEGIPLLRYAPAQARIEVSDPSRLAEGLAVLVRLLRLPGSAPNRLRVGTVNGEAAAGQPWAAALELAGFVPGLKEHTLWR